MSIEARKQYLIAIRERYLNSSKKQKKAILPLLANIYLHYVLDIWFEKKIKPRLKGRSRLIRYADDFIVSFEDENDCTEFQALLKARLNQFEEGLRPG